MDNIDRPIFLLGTGRCGSTYLQRLLCSSEDIWIWGEHDGFLASITRMLKVLEKNRPLDKLHFARTGPPSGVPDLIKMDAIEVAWMNSFSRDEFVASTRRLLIDLFTAHLPEGKRRWGFKEIRYGPASRVPELLLEIFPHATIVITARRAFPTIVSAVSSWTKNVLKEGNAHHDEPGLRKAINERAENWLRYFEYFAELMDKYPNRVLVNRLENPAELPQLFNALGIGFNGELQELSTKAVNGSKNAKVVQEDAGLIAVFKEELGPYLEKFGEIEENLGYEPAR